MIDNSRNFRTKKHKYGAVDGMVAGAAPRKTSSTLHNSKSSPAAGNIGSFKSSEGFHPAAQPTIKTSGNHTPAARNPVRDDTGRIRLQLPDAPNFKHKKQHKWRKIFLKSFAAFAVVALVLGGYMFGKGYLKARQVFKGGAEGATALQEEVDPSRLRGEGDGRVNIMVLGKGGTGHEAPDLTDTILLLSVDPTNKEAAMLSIPRDLFVKTSQAGSMKINAVYSSAKNAVLNSDSSQKEQAEKAGLDAIEGMVENVTGLPVHYRTMVDFEAFRKGIDTVGGVTIDVKEQLSDSTMAWMNGGSPVIANVGVQTFDGKRALMYARSRYGSARGDFDRSQRQREIILALKDKIMSAGTYSNPVKISSLMDAFSSNVQTNLSIKEILKLYDITKEIDGSKFLSVGLADPPNDYVTTSFIAGQSVVVPKAGLNNYAAIQNYLRNTIKDGYIKSENPNIVVLNGTTVPGLATKRADELKSYGYNVTEVNDAPTKNYQNTTLVDLRDGLKKYTKRYLELRLGTTAVDKLPDATISYPSADFVIIVGENDSLNR